MLTRTATLIIFIYAMVITASILLSSSPLGPLLALVSLALGVVVGVRILDDRDGSVLDIGVFYTLLVALYGIYPLVVYSLNGFTFQPLNDNRLFIAKPAPEEVASIAWYYVTYLTAFAVAYFLVRGRILHRREAALRLTRHTTVVLIFSVYLLIEVTLFALQSYAAYETTTYSSTYLRYKELPLWVQQLAKHLDWIAISLKIAAVTAFVSNLKKYKTILIIWITFEILHVFFSLGARTELFLMLAAMMIAYDFLVRPMKTRIIIIIGFVGLITFMAIGAIRNNNAIDNVPQLLTSSAGEFESIFANAFEINELVSTGNVGEVPMSAHLADFLSFVPQQLLPFKKWDFPTWYGMMFYPDYYESGGGFAFGVIPESMLGFGMVELAVRGLAIAILFAFAMHVVSRNREKFWIAVFYVWLTVQSYFTFRSGSLSLLPKLILGFIPAVLIIKTLELAVRIPNNSGRSR